MDDRENGKAIKRKGKKLHIDMEETAPIPRSSYRASFQPVEIKDILIEATPNLPRYSLRWLANSESRSTNSKMQQTMSHFKRRNIVITEPKLPFQITKPYCPPAKGIFSTEKKSHDSYLHESFANPISR